MRTQISRRSILALSTCAPMMALGGCCWVITSLDCIKEDVDTIRSFADAFQSAVNSNLIPLPAQAAAIQKAVAEIDAAADLIDKLTDPSGNNGAVQTFIDVVNALVTIAGQVPSPPMPPEVHLALIAAAALLPVIEGFFGVKPSKPKAIEVVGIKAEVDKQAFSEHGARAKLREGTMALHSLH